MKNNEILEKVVSGNHSKLSDEVAYECLNIATKLYPIYENTIKNANDVFLTCSALNYLNAYIKVDSGKAAKLFRSFYQNHPEIDNYLNEMKSKFNNGGKNYTLCSNKADTYKCFKKLVKPLMYKIMENNLLSNDVKISVQYDKGMSLGMIEVYNVQFSYHGISIFDEDEKLQALLKDKTTWIEWRGVRLQALASHTLNIAKSLDNLSLYNNECIA